MMVLSDGSPAGYGNHRDLDKHLKDTVKRLSGEGINMVGIGIETDCVKDYYENYAVLNEADQLPIQVMGQLKNALLN